MSIVTRELAAFLRTRRERLDPRDVALPARRTTHRRTPGLRREEVAELAGVSVDYVIRVEQGRLRPSPEVLEALAGALRLSEDERVYLFDLARQRPAQRRPAAGADTAGPLSRLVLDLSPLPAMVLNHRFDILAWNPEMSALMIDFAALPPEQRNSMWLCTLHQGLRAFYRDRERTLREGIADLRAAWAAHPDDAALAALIEELTAGSEEVARLWALRDVRVNGRGRKRLRHAEAGSLTVEYEVLTPLQAPDQRLVIYRPADPASRRALEEITAGCALAAGPVPAG
ncbi:helix-turn-helix domain-containing protein [Actinomadura sp. ATCC 31491]|uniref:Helix-turn-helix domain-containing protein n=1 Tax=Actinomadura luzonensis TaxID=2805427 RepID=A0ABT0GA00_9ACTN|nr:helix-turn-helix domain-containing protein [Actinomadura luzonensis]MCK2220918.1 helix-turn-helix domain-containing protein [Actinomadura luzonensis]